MGDQQPSGWWLASDGRWYPPDAQPGPPPPSAPVWQPASPGGYPGPQRWCPACRSAVLVSATVCPTCGTPLASPRSKGAAVLLAIFLTFWTWVYTYKRDAWKFWLGLILSIVGVVTTFFLIGIVILIGVWLWAVIDAGIKPEYWYQQYPNPVPT
jgi:hypothetical protein